MPDHFDTKIIKITKSNPKDSESKKSEFVDDEVPIPVPKQMGKTITKARSEKKMSIKDLATKSNIPLKIISDWENGKGIYKEKVAEKLGKALGIELKMEKDTKPVKK